MSYRIRNSVWRKECDWPDPHSRKTAEMGCLFRLSLSRHPLLFSLPCCVDGLDQQSGELERGCLNKGPTHSPVLPSQDLTPVESCLQQDFQPGQRASVPCCWMHGGDGAVHSCRSASLHLSRRVVPSLLACAKFPFVCVLQPVQIMTSPLLVRSGHTSIWVLLLVWMPRHSPQLAPHI